MPTVAAYGQRKIGPTALPGVRASAAETALSRGAGVAQAQGEIGGAIAELGAFGAKAASTFSADLIAVRNEAAQRADEVALLEAQNKLAGWTTARLYDPEKGALTVKGKASMGLRGEVGAEYTKVVGDIGAGLTTPRQREAWAKLSSREGQELALTLERHTYSEMQRFEGEELAAFVTNKRTEAVASALEPRRVGMALDSAIAAIKTSAPRLGLGPEQVAEQIDKTRTATHVGVIEQLIAKKQPGAARAYFEETRSQISGDAATRIETAITTATTQTEGLRTAEALWSAHGPKGDTDPIALDTMETAARARYANDPETLQATLHFLRERKAGVDASRRDREESTAGAVWVAASRGATLSAVTSMPEFLRLPGKAQSQVTDYIVARAERVESRAAAVESRAASREGREAARESRAYTAETRAENVKERRGWARYWELSAPAALDATSENALQAMRGELGDDHVNRLLTQKRTLVKSEDVVRAATIDEDLFKTTAQRAGLNAYTPKGDQEKAVLGQLKNAVETAIDVEQQKLGKALTRDAKQALMQGLVDQRVLLNYWGVDPEMIARTVVDPDDRRKAYVPIARVPAQAITDGLAYARTLSPALAALPDAELRTRFTDRIQRAYAHRLMGATTAEIQAIMQGKD